MFVALLATEGGLWLHSNCIPVNGKHPHSQASMLMCLWTQENINLVSHVLVMLQFGLWVCKLVRVCVIILPEEASEEQLQAASNICQSRRTHVLSLLCLAVEVCVFEGLTVHTRCVDVWMLASVTLRTHKTTRQAWWWGSGCFRSWCFYQARVFGFWWEWGAFINRAPKTIPLKKKLQSYSNCILNHCEIVPSALLTFSLCH